MSGALRYLSRLVFVGIVFLAACGGDQTGGTAGAVLSSVNSCQTDCDEDNTQSLKVESTSPGDGDSGVDYYTKITAVFNQDVDSESINNGSFRVTDSSGADIAGAVDYDAGSDSAEFVPSGPMQSLVNYTVTLTTAITDTLGNALEQDVVWSFTVRDKRWNERQLVSSGVSHVLSSEADMAVDANANIIAVWSEDFSFPEDDVHISGRKFLNSSGVWSDAQIIDGGVAETVNNAPAFASDAEGNGMMAWRGEKTSNDNAYIYVRQYDSSSETWTKEATLFTCSNKPGDCTGLTRPQIVSNTSGQAMVLWQRRRTCGAREVIDNYAVRCDVNSGCTSNIFRVNDRDCAGGDVYDSSDAGLAIDESGNVIVVWAEDLTPTARRYVRSSDKWQTEVSLNDDGHARVQQKPAVAMGPGRDGMAVWQQPMLEDPSWVDSCRSMVFENGGNPPWHSPKQVDNYSWEHDDDVIDLKIEADASGNMLVVWTQIVGGVYHIRSRQHLAGGTWQTPTRLSSPYDTKIDEFDVAVNARGDAVVVWTHRNDGQTSPQYLQVARLVDGKWHLDELYDAGSGSVLDSLRVVVDDSSRATVLYRAVYQSISSLFAQRFD